MKKLIFFSLLTIKFVSSSYSQEVFNGVIKYSIKNSSQKEFFTTFIFNNNYIKEIDNSSAKSKSWKVNYTIWNTLTDTCYFISDSKKEVYVTKYIKEIFREINSKIEDTLYLNYKSSIANFINLKEIQIKDITDTIIDKQKIIFSTNLKTKARGSIFGSNNLNFSSENIILYNELVSNQKFNQKFNFHSISRAIEIIKRKVNNSEFKIPRNYKQFIFTNNELKEKLFANSKSNKEFIFMAKDIIEKNQNAPLNIKDFFYFTNVKKLTLSTSTHNAE